MATRSAIAVSHGGKIKSIYAHYDGYTAYNGRILNEFYQDSVKVNKLISMGDASSLGVEIGEQVEFSAELPEHESGFKSQCIFYGRDRGEENTGFKTFQTTRDFIKHYKGSWCEYFYLFEGGKWWVKSYQGKWQSLDRAIHRLDEQPE